MKKFLLQICSAVLTVVMLANMLPLQVFAETLTANQNTQAVQKPSGDASVSVAEEVTARRTEHSKVFRMNDGTFLAALYPEPVHYEKNGSWQDIDNTLQLHLDGTISNTAGVWDVRLPNQLTADRAVTISKDGYTLSMVMSGQLNSGGGLEVASTSAMYAVEQTQTAKAKVQTIDWKSRKAEADYEELVSEKLSSAVLYENVFADTDLRYDLNCNTVKESVVLESYSSTLRGYRYTLHTGQMQPRLQPDGSIHFYDKDGTQIVLVMEAPYLVDAAWAFNYDVQVQLTGSDGSYTLTYLLPGQWLASEERQWPVILDPTITVNLQQSNVRDVTVTEKYGSRPNQAIIECGYGQQDGIQRFFLMYDEIPVLKSSDVVLSAQVRLYKLQTSTTTANVQVHKVLGTWDEDTITWSNKPDFDETIEDFNIVRELGFYYWDVTDIVRGWYSGENTGIMFKSNTEVEEAKTNNWKQFISSEYSYYPDNMPAVTFTFRNNNGLESYWDYTASAAGRAGTGYVNQYTGNLVWVHNDIGFGGNRMPVSIQHIYNANDASVNAYGVGSGWQTNFHQTVQLWPENSNYYVWNDDDGTDHYFHEVSGSWVDEDGLELELELTTGGSGTQTYCITDKYGNKRFFDSAGRLSMLQNNQATPSTITVTYTDSTDHRISTITDGAGRVYSFEYNGELLSQIRYQVTGSTELSYVAFGYTDTRLTRVTDKDGLYVEYGYNDNGLLNLAEDWDGYRLCYSYNTTAEDKPARVSRVQEFHDNTAGGDLQLEYAHNQTTMRDYSGNVQILQFNNYGNTVCIQDGEGRAQYAQFAKDTNPEGGKGNQLTLSSKLQNTVSNYIADSSFENGSPWEPCGNIQSANEISTDYSYMGSKSMLVIREAFGPSFVLQPGESCTLSAYVKTVTDKARVALYAGSSLLAYTQKEANQDWTREEVSYTNNGTSAVTVQVRLAAADYSGAYFDCVQFEKTPTASRYNLVDNGDFRFIFDSWSKTNCDITGTVVEASQSATPQLDNSVFQLIGATIYEKRLTQTVKVSGSAGDTFVFGGWAKGNAARLGTIRGDTREFAIRVRFKYASGSFSNYFTAQFNPDSEEWQYVAGAAVAPQAYSSVEVQVVYDHNVNTIFFDGIQLFREEFGSSYTYDDNGNVISVVDLQKQTTTYQYTDNDLTKVIQNDKAKMTYTYDDHHNVLTATTEEGLVYHFAYDQWGNNTSVSVGSGDSKITSSATYSADGNRLVSTTDALGNVTTYDYDPDTNVLNWVQYPEDTADTRTEYTYDEMYRMASAAAATDTGLNMSASYVYEDDLLSEIHTPTTSYYFLYTTFGMRGRVYAGGRELALYHYQSRTNYLTSLDYGNGDKVQYAYDKQGRVTKQTYEDGDTVTYKYDNSGALATVTDSATGRTTTYYYDFTDRLMKYVESGEDYYHSVGYEYDQINNLTALVETINGVDRTTTYTYDDDNRITSTQTGDVSVHYTYDAYGRITQQVTKNGDAVVLTESYTYVPNSTRVSTHTTTAGGTTTTYTYTYDDNGNILSVSDGTYITSYTYDSANQLIREDNEFMDHTQLWTYDDAGNIQSRLYYFYTTDDLNEVEPEDGFTYTYGDSSWGDLLTGYDGRTITYDAIGNPLSDGTWTYTWEHGRQLVSMSKGTENWTYTYNSDGMRTSRTNGTATYTYTYNGSQLTGLTYQNGNETDTLFFSYDASGTPLTMDWNGVLHYYVTNIQGDVLAILDSDGIEIASYEYTSWGQFWSWGIENIDRINPLTYRGYVQDYETGLYYVSSRYYDPEIGRWINADNQIAGVGGEVLGYNMFAYCMNNPVNMSDPSGNWPRWATIALGAVAAVAAVAVTVVTLGAAAPAAVCTLTSVAMSVGVSYGVASAAATVAVAATTVAAAAYAGDIAYSAVTGDSLLLDTVFQGNTDVYNTGLAITSIATAGMLEAAAQSPGVCFVAGTPVLAACGYIAIEEIKVGDMVWAENPETGEKELKEVVQTFVNETTELIYIQVGSEEIVTTPEHPFYSPVKGWIAACKLRAGDILVLQNGKYVTVEKVQHEILEAPITVYNFEVEDFHTYYVGKCAVLVHNTCGGNSSSRGVGGKGWVGDKTWRENVSTVGNGGTITSLNGGVPTKAQAMQLINQSGGTPLRIEGAHQFPNPHNYTHINYVTSSGVKGTIKIFE